MDRHYRFIPFIIGRFPVQRPATAAMGGYIGLLICLWLLTAVPVGAQGSLSDEALIQALRRGGYNIYFRHAATDWSRDDQVSARGDWRSCRPDRMRQLSDEGRRTARRIGAAIRRLDIPVGRVVSSEYCRTRKTAEQMNLGPVETTLDIMNLRAAEWVGGRDTAVDRAGRELSTPPEQGTNTVYVAHGNLMRAVTGAYTGEAGAVVLEPGGDGDLRVVATLMPDDWERLADRFGGAGQRE
jgi:broad specificity phosphatase PhoE